MSSNPDVFFFRTEDIKVGDIVEMDAESRFAGRPFQVIKVNKTTFDVKGEDGTMVRADRLMVCPSDKPFTPVADDEVITLGSIVTFKRDTRVGQKIVGTSVMFAVLKLNGDKISIARLGGEEGKYLNVAKTSVAVVPLAQIARTS
jgi:hypothetical protein